MKKDQVDHTFGGYHTDLKLSMVEQYLKAYTKALSKPVKPFGVKFDLWYIDAFAGTGYRTVDIPEKEQGLFAEEPRAAERILVRGSAQIALDVTPKFDFVVFIEKRQDFAQELKYAKDRLSTIFGSVLDPIRLPREKGTVPRYLLFLCISSTKPRAIEIATNIGNHILKSGSSS